MREGAFTEPATRLGAVVCTCMCTLYAHSQRHLRAVAAVLGSPWNPFAVGGPGLAADVM